MGKLLRHLKSVLTICFGQIGMRPLKLRPLPQNFFTSDCWKSKRLSHCGPDKSPSQHGVWSGLSLYSASVPLRGLGHSGRMLSACQRQNALPLKFACSHAALSTLVDSAGIFWRQPARVAAARRVVAAAEGQRRAAAEAVVRPRAAVEAAVILLRAMEAEA